MSPSATHLRRLCAVSRAEMTGSSIETSPPPRLLLRLNQERLAAEMARQIVLDRSDEIGVRRAQRKPARQQMEIMDVALAPPQPVGLAPQRGGEIAGHQRHDEKHGEVDHLARLGDRKAVERREKEEIENGDARERGDHGRADAPADRRDDHRDQIERRMKLERRISRHQRQYERRCADHQQRENEIGQRCAERAFCPIPRWVRRPAHPWPATLQYLPRRCSLYAPPSTAGARSSPIERRAGMRRKPAARRHADPSRRPPD